MVVTRKQKSEINRAAHELSLRFYEMMVKRLTDQVMQAKDSDPQEMHTVVADEADRIIDEYGL